MLTKYLEKRGITQEEAAEEIGIRQGTISRICSTGDCSLKTARLLYTWSNREVNLLETAIDCGDQDLEDYVKNTEFKKEATA